MISGFSLWPFAHRVLACFPSTQYIFVFGRDLYSYKIKSQVSTNKMHASESIIPCRILVSYQTQTKRFSVLNTSYWSFIQNLS